MKQEKVNHTAEGPELKKRKLSSEEEMNVLFDEEFERLLKNSDTSLAIQNIIVVGRLLDIPPHKLFELISNHNRLDYEHPRLSSLDHNKFAEQFLLLKPETQEKLKSKALSDFDDIGGSIQNQYNFFSNIFQLSFFQELVNDAETDVVVEKAINNEILEQTTAIDRAVEKEKKKEKLTPDQQHDLEVLQGRVERFICMVLKFDLTVTEEAVALLNQHFKLDDYDLFDDKISKYKNQLKVLQKFEKESANKLNMETLKEFLVKEHPLPVALLAKKNSGNDTEQKRVITLADYEDNYEDIYDAFLPPKEKVYTPARNNPPVSVPSQASTMQSITGLFSSVVEGVRSKFNSYL